MGGRRTSDTDTMNAAESNDAPPLSEWDAKMRDRRRRSERPETRLWREAAENPNATASTLGDLWETTRRHYLVQANQQPEAGVVLAMEAVAAHPNTPPDVLWDLFPVCARAFCANPVAPLLLLERPDFVSHLSPEFCAALVREEAAPPALVSLMAKGSDGWLAREARLHITLAGEIDTQDEDEWEAALNAHWQAFCRLFVPPRKESSASDENHAHWHNDLAGLGLMPAWGMQAPLWVEPRMELSPDAQEWLRFEAVPDSPEARAYWARIAIAFKDKPQLAAHLRQDATPFDLLALLHTPGSERGVLREAIVGHPNANETVLQSLARTKPSKYVRVLMAQSPHASPALLAKLATDDDPRVRRVARRNPNASPNARELSRRAVLKKVHPHPGDVSLLVHFAVGLHSGFNHEARVQSGQSDEFALRLLATLGLSTKPVPLSGDPANRTSRDLLCHLARDGNRLVRWAAQKRLANPSWTFSWETEA